MKGAFTYSVKTIKSNDYFTVLASGSKKDMLKFAETFDKVPETLESRIKRAKDGAIVYTYAK